MSETSPNAIVSMPSSTEEKSEEPQANQNQKDVEPFSAEKAIGRIRQDILAIVHSHNGLLSRITKNDFQRLIQPMLHLPNTGLILHLINECFTQWGGSTDQQVNASDLREAAEQIKVAIDELDDSLFFGDLSDIDSKKLKLNKVGRSLSNSSTSMSVTITSQINERLVRLSNG